MENRLFVDMDGTLATWKNISSEEELYEQGYFKNLLPYENVLTAIKDIAANDNNITVCILSAYLTDSKYAYNEKKEWLQKYLPEVSEKNIFLIPFGKDKFTELKENGINLTSHDILLDDYTYNLQNWEAKGFGKNHAVKLINPINNSKGTWTGTKVSYKEKHIDKFDIDR